MCREKQTVREERKIYTTASQFIINTPINLLLGCIHQTGYPDIFIMRHCPTSPGNIRNGPPLIAIETISPVLGPIYTPNHQAKSLPMSDYENLLKRYIGLYLSLKESWRYDFGSYIHIFRVKISNDRDTMDVGHILPIEIQDGCHLYNRKLHRSISHLRVETET